MFTYREIMELVLRYSQIRRPILSLPYWVGTLQGFILEKLPESIFTLTRDQVSTGLAHVVQHPHKKLVVLNTSQLKLSYTLDPSACHRLSPCPATLHHKHHMPASHLIARMTALTLVLLASDSR